MLPIHTRIMLTVNISDDGTGRVVVNERSRTGEYIVTNEFIDQDAVDIYNKLTDDRSE